MLGARCTEDEQLAREAVRVVSSAAVAAGMLSERRHTVDFSDLGDAWTGVGISSPTNGAQISPSSYSNQQVPFCILDLRSYTAALGQMGVTGGGYENSEYYPTAGSPVYFLNLGNIHAVNSAHIALIKGLASRDLEGWYGRVEQSGWFGLVAEVLRASTEVAGKVASGFRVLIQKEFIAMGHPFRARHQTANVSLFNRPTPTTFAPLFTSQFQHPESGQARGTPPSPSVANYSPPQHAPSPIFLLFLTCVRHLILENPSRFEFHEGLLLILVRAASGDSPYGDFLLNNELERKLMGAFERTGSVWRWIEERWWWFVNPHYDLVEEEMATAAKVGWGPGGRRWSLDMALPSTNPLHGQTPIGLWEDLYLADIQPIVRLFSLPASAFAGLTPAARRLIAGNNFELAQELRRLEVTRNRRVARRALRGWRDHVMNRKLVLWEAAVVGRWAAETIVAKALDAMSHRERTKPRDLEEFVRGWDPSSVGAGLRATRVRRIVGADGKVKEVEFGIEADDRPSRTGTAEGIEVPGGPDDAASSAETEIGWVTMSREAAPDVEIVFFLQEEDWADIEYQPAHAGARANGAGSPPVSAKGAMYSAIEKQLSEAME
ncbi:Alpha-1,3-mannosyltransferase-like protein [Gonapodya sp. JEL0774]|nr:Alpha-1,3-mannosyltransferase-like protein [Gonapodya sp. JEL0774]